ncbi:sigma factor-like helix-turn-helix DNA-binding protein [Streptomyces sp. NPDC006261]|uniref:sigma factor-like helix-turn-helix DNA-binding protein n=1 Tax=Streptomyces sp. NPDC006261 TaxID=3156739 RepID=UPI0033A1DC1E
METTVVVHRDEESLVIDHHRARQVRPLEHMAVEELDASSDNTATTIDSHAVSQALAEPNEQQRSIICLMYSPECGVAQAAEHLGIPAGTVKSRSFSAVRALRRALEKQGILGVRPRGHGHTAVNGACSQEGWEARRN